MQFSAVIIALASFTGLAAAHPATQQFQAQAEASLKALEAAGCDKIKCVAAAAPMAAACAAALVEAGLNPIADLACFAAIAANIAVPPAPCQSCL